MQNQFDWKEFFDLAEQKNQRHPEWRIGQIFFNVFQEMYPKLANDLIYTDQDPFNNSAKIPGFISWVNESFGKETT